MRADDAETELRGLLRDGIPRLTAPPDRMARVRHRVALRTRRRAAVATAVTCVVAVIALTVPSAGGPFAREAAPGAAPSPDPVATVGGQVRDSSAAPGHRLLFRFPSADVRVKLPEHWQAEEVPGGGFAIGYAADQPLGPAARCPDPTVGAFACVPLRRLTDGGTVVAVLAPGPRFKVPHVPAPFHGMLSPAPPYTPGPDPDCRALGGTTELQALGRIKDAVPVVAYACVRGTSPGAVVRAKSILAATVFDGVPRPGDPAPTPPGTPGA